MAGQVVGTMSAPPLPSAPARAERNVVDENVRIVAPQAHALDIVLAALAHTGCGATTLHMHWQV